MGGQYTGKIANPRKVDATCVEIVAWMKSWSLLGASWLRKPVLGAAGALLGAILMDLGEVLDPRPQDRAKSENVIFWTHDF